MYSKRIVYRFGPVWDSSSLLDEYTPPNISNNVFSIVASKSVLKQDFSKRRNIENASVS